MKYVTIDIPVTALTKKFLDNRYSKEEQIDGYKLRYTDFVAKYLLEQLQRKRKDYEKLSRDLSEYESSIKICLHIKYANRFGYDITRNGVRNFNNFIKTQVNMLMCIYVESGKEHNEKLEIASLIRDFKAKFDLTEDELSSDTAYRNYLRYLEK